MDNIFRDETTGGHKYIKPGEAMYSGLNDLGRILNEENSCATKGEYTSGLEYLFNSKPGGIHKSKVWSFKLNEPTPEDPGAPEIPSSWQSTESNEAHKIISTSQKPTLENFVPEKIQGPLNNKVNF